MLSTSTARNVLVVLLVACGLFFMQFWPRYPTETVIFQTEQPPPTKIILYWTKMFSKNDFYLGLGDSIFQGCPVSNCYATNNKSMLPVEEFDALVFHGMEYGVRYNDVPKNRSSGQFYVYGNLESPANTWSNNVITKFGKFFNWTMTYRTDSDIYRPYGHIYNQKTNYTLPSLDQIRNKTKKIAWQVSHCQTSSKRENLYAKLNEKMHVDVYGKCGDLSCPRSEAWRCWKNIEANYKFYLSFENSYCEEYVTEKLFYALKYDVIPIVYGWADYDIVAPPHSVIDVRNFENVDKLVEYLEELDSDHEKYLEYFKWKSDYVIDTTFGPTLCDLCAKLNRESGIIKVYEDITKWWTGPGFSKCKTGNNLPEIVPRDVVKSF